MAGARELLAVAIDNQHRERVGIRARRSQVAWIWPLLLLEHDEIPAHRRICIPNPSSKGEDFYISRLPSRAR